MILRRGLALHDPLVRLLRNRSRNTAAVERERHALNYGFAIAVAGCDQCDYVLFETFGKRFASARSSIRFGRIARIAGWR